MSASDKKKMKKESPNAGLTQREMKERADAQAAKKNKAIYTVVGVVCVIIAAALLVWNSGFWKKNAVAATVDGQSYRVPDMQYYYAQARNAEYDMAMMYAQYGITSPYNPSLPDGAQWYNEEEGKTYADYFRENALTNLTQIKALTKAANEEGYVLSEEGHKQVDNALSQIDMVCAQNGLTRGSYFAQVYGNGVTEKVFVRNLTEAVLADEYQRHHAESYTYSDEELETYYGEHKDDLDSFTYRSFFIKGTAPNPVDDEGNPLKDADGNVVTAAEAENKAALEAAKVKAQQAVEEIKAAGSTEEAVIAAAPKYCDAADQETYSDPDSFLTADVKGSDLAGMNSTLSSWLKNADRKSGDVEALETPSGYYVSYFMGRARSEANTVNIRHILVKAEVAEDAEDKTPTADAMAAAKAEAEKLMGDFKAGDATAESFGALAEEYSDDPGSSSNGGQYTFVEQGRMFEGFDKWIFDPARQSGDVDLVENPQAGQQGWHVVYFEGKEAPIWKHTSTVALQNDAQTKWMDEQEAAMEAKTEEGMQYVGDVNTAVPTPAETAPAESQAPAETETPAE